MKKLLWFFACCGLLLTACQYHDPSEEDLRRIQKQWVVEFEGDTYLFDIGVTTPDVCIRAIQRRDSLFHEKDRYAYTIEMKNSSEGKMIGYGIEDAEMDKITLKFTNLSDNSVDITYLILKSHATASDTLIRIVK